MASTRAIKSKNRDDLTVLAIDAGATVSGVFTQNRYPAPPVQVCRTHLGVDKTNGDIRGLAINAGIANAGTLGRGLHDAQESCRLLANLLGCEARQILPFSTGVIMEPLPMENYARGLQRCAGKLIHDNWLAAASAIMTTDTVTKGISRQVQINGNTITVTGIAKGSGMIHPNMATMLAFVATDAAIPAPLLAQWQRDIVDDTFNAISVDGDTSTNDSFMLIATGKAGDGNHTVVRDAIAGVCAHLAECIVRDGEGASKLVTIRVYGGSDKETCLRVARAVACSPLVKTALAAGDANVGRFLMAIGNAGGNFVPDCVTMHVDSTPVLFNGGLHSEYCEEKTAAVLAMDEIMIVIGLGKGAYEATLKTCDLTARYIEINAAYRS